jgi:hypothetical protein
MTSKFRIVVYEDFNGKKWYKPQVKKHLLDTWKYLNCNTYSESYHNEEMAIKKIEEWKLILAKENFKDKIIKIYPIT